MGLSLALARTGIQGLDQSRSRDAHQGEAKPALSLPILALAFPLGRRGAMLASMGPRKSRVVKQIQTLVYAAPLLPLTAELTRRVSHLGQRLRNVNNDPELNGEYWLLEHWRDARVLVDVGFNTGDWARRALATAPEAHVHAFDPDREVAAVAGEMH